MERKRKKPTASELILGYLRAHGGHAKIGDVARYLEKRRGGLRQTNQHYISNLIKSGIAEKVGWRDVRIAPQKMTHAERVARVAEIVPKPPPGPHDAINWQTATRDCYEDERAAAWAAAKRGWKRLVVPR